MISIFALAACLQAPFYLHNGDRVTFYGDSITEDGRYTIFVETYVRTRFPNLDVRFSNCGWSGDRVTGGGGGDAAKRIKLDFKPTNPTVVTIMLGMNDGSYTPFSEAKDATFAKGYDDLIKLMQAAAPNARYTLIQTSPYDDFAHDSKNYNDVLLQMGLQVKTLASKYKFDFVDFDNPLAQVLRQAARDDANAAKELVHDQIHPGEAGHLVMAATLLKAWGAPSLVSEVSIDGKTGELKKALGAKVNKTGILQWTETDAVLPMPINFGDPGVRLIADQSGVLDSLDDETLTVSNLDSGTYSISIDGKAVGKASADDLGKGLNLSHFYTPMMRQAFDVQGQVIQKFQLSMYEWRTVRRGLAAYGNPEQASKGLKTLEEGLVKSMPALAVPTPHTFSITKD